MNFHGRAIKLTRVGLGRSILGVYLIFKITMQTKLLQSNFWNKILLGIDFQSVEKMTEHLNNRFHFR